MIFLLNVVYSLATVAMLLLLGQFAVRVISFGRHEQNPVYRMFRFLNSPVTRAVRTITPAKVSDEHVPVVAALLLFWVIVLLGFEVLPRMAGAK